MVFFTGVLQERPPPKQELAGATIGPSPKGALGFSTSPRFRWEAEAPPSQSDHSDLARREPPPPIDLQPGHRLRPNRYLQRNPVLRLLTIPLTTLATATVTALVELGNWVRLLTGTAGEMKDRVFIGRSPLSLPQLFDQADRVGWGSVPLVSLVSFFLGLTMALLTGYELEKFGTERLVPGLVAVSFSRELGPLLTGIMVAARIGAAFTAELGTMTVAEEIEAIEAMGIGPLRFLIAPRLLSVGLLMPCLAVISNLSALAGGFLVSKNTLHISFPYYAQMVQENLLVRDIISGSIKSICFGIIIGVISCYKGLAVEGGAAGVGTSTTSSVVVAITAVIGFDSLFNICMTTLFER